MQVYVARYKDRYIREIHSYQEGQYGEELSFIIETTESMELAKIYKDKKDLIQDLGIDNPNFEYKCYAIWLKEKEVDNYDNYACNYNNLHEIKKHIYLCQCENKITLEVESRLDVI